MTRVAAMCGSPAAYCFCPRGPHDHIEVTHGEVGEEDQGRANDPGHSPRRALRSGEAGRRARPLADFVREAVGVAPTLLANLIWQGVLPPEEYDAFVLQHADGFAGKEVWAAHIFLRLMFPRLGREIRDAIMATSPAQEAIALIHSTLTHSGPSYMDEGGSRLP